MKPDDIPQEVWTAAVACSKDMMVRDMATGGTRPEVYIARAIMAEREACAQLIATHPENLGAAKGRMVSAIRNRGAPHP